MDYIQDYKILADYEHTLRTYRQGAEYLYCNCVSCDYLGGGLSESRQGVIIKRDEYKRIKKKYFAKSQLFIYGFIIFLSFKKMREMISSDRSPKFITKTYRRIVNKLNQL